MQNDHCWLSESSLLWTTSCSQLNSDLSSNEDISMKLPWKPNPDLSVLLAASQVQLFFHLSSSTHR